MGNRSSADAIQDAVTRSAKEAAQLVDVHINRFANGDVDPHVYGATDVEQWRGFARWLERLFVERTTTSIGRAIAEAEEDTPAAHARVRVVAAQRAAAVVAALVLVRTATARWRALCSRLRDDVEEAELVALALLCNVATRSLETAGRAAAAANDTFLSDLAALHGSVRGLCDDVEQAWEQTTAGAAVSKACGDRLDQVAEVTSSQLAAAQALLAERIGRLRTSERVAHGGRFSARRRPY